MIQAEDLDEDFFVPPTGKTLASIFGEKFETTQEDENTTLKYVAPKPHTSDPGDMALPKLPGEPSREETTPAKLSECIFARALFAYQLVNGQYVAKGKLGFALIKKFTPEVIQLVLYDANKKTLSSLTCTQEKEMTVQDNYITYYDDVLNNWSLLCANSEEVLVIVSEFKKLETLTLIMSNNVASTIDYPTVAPKPSNKSKHLEVESQHIKNDTESDTDTNLNKKTKAAILSRMAMMGRPILPQPPITSERTSDSSDTNDENTHHKMTRHKTVKSFINAKRSADSASIETLINTDKNMAENAIVPIPIQVSSLGTRFSSINGQLLPVTATNLLHESNVDHRSEMNLYLSEHRATSSELRININRVSDKVDKILDKITVSGYEEKKASENFTSEIFRKLLVEYEDKIKKQDYKIKLLEKLNLNTTKQSSPEENVVLTQQANKYIQLLETYKQCQLEIEINNKNLLDLQDLYNKKELEVSNLQLKIEEYDVMVQNLQKINCDNTLRVENEKMQEKINEFKNTIELQSLELNESNLRHMQICDELIQLKRKSDDSCQTKVADGNQAAFTSQIKTLMNNTFRSLTTHFVSNEMYSGETIINIAASVIKNSTLEAIKSSIGISE